MVDSVGPAASLITVLELTAVVGKTLVTFVRDVRDAPKELQQVAQRILGFQSTLDLKSRLLLPILVANGEAGSQFLMNKDMDAFKEALCGAQDCLKSVQTLMTSYKDPGSKVLAARWVLRDRKPILRLEEHLRAVESISSNMLAPLNTSVNPACPACGSDKITNTLTRKLWQRYRLLRHLQSLLLS